MRGVALRGRCFSLLGVICLLIREVWLMGVFTGDAIGEEMGEDMVEEMMDEMADESSSKVKLRGEAALTMVSLEA